MVAVGVSLCHTVQEAAIRARRDRSPEWPHGHVPHLLDMPLTLRLGRSWWGCTSVGLDAWSPA